MTEQEKTLEQLEKELEDSLLGRRDESWGEAIAYMAEQLAPVVVLAIVYGLVAYGYAVTHGII